ncbi:hypothetical protein PISMIDRAFT_233443 [Pisolithus microcarpus 441]|uniref:Unplaced genomic scaffold scaffold_151, whole genome shotgun sequence n=1 Tax=Pisolithus microcarpus 441 TaxID=765257 RepID=A0A0C9YKP2_9AGAM|nr:hypothetical protein PISMIDRAFT_233443 [Pisolithus microcarpus 441]
MLSIVTSSSDRLIGLNNRDSHMCSVGFSENDNPLLSKSIVKGIDAVLSAPDDMPIDFNSIGVVPASDRDGQLSNTASKQHLYRKQDSNFKLIYSDLDGIQERRKST